MTSPLRSPLLDARLLAARNGHTLTRFGRASCAGDALYTEAACTACGATITAQATPQTSYCYGSAADRACRKGQTS